MGLRLRPNKKAENAREAFAELYEYYLPKVFRYISYQVADVHLAEDLTSAVFEKALTRLDSYRSNKASFSTWLLSIARNAVTTAMAGHCLTQSTKLAPNVAPG